MCISNCLKIIQTIFPDRITEEDLDELVETIDAYLTNMMRIFKMKLTHNTQVTFFDTLSHRNHFDMDNESRKQTQDIYWICRTNK